MEHDERVRLLRALDRVLLEDTVLALELLAIQGSRYPELARLQDDIYGVHLALTAFRLRLLGVRVRPTSGGYVFSRPVDSVAEDDAADEIPF